jgi:GDPmannose 4,6-dehydratase
LPDNYVIATDKRPSVRELVEEAFSCVEFDWRKYMKNDPRYDRPSEVDLLTAIRLKVRNFCHGKLKHGLRIWVRLKVDADIETLNQRATSRS